LASNSTPRRRPASGRPELRVFVPADAICIAGSFLLAYWIRCLSGWFPTVIPIQPVHYWYLGALTCLMILLFSFHGLYKLEVMTTVIDHLTGIFTAVGFGMLLLLTAAFLAKMEYFTERRLVLVLSWVFSLVSLAITRVVILRPRIAALRGKASLTPRALVVGVGEAAKTFVRQAREARSPAFQIAGFIEDEPGAQGSLLEGIPVLGSTDELEDLVAREEIDEIFLAKSGMRQDEAIELLSKCMRSKVPVKLVTDSFGLMASEATTRMIDGVPTLTVRESPMKGPALAVKRAADCVTSCLCIVILSPIFIVIAVGIKLTSTGPVFFRQTRIGQAGKEFTFYKFRTMRVDTDERLHREYAQQFINGKSENHPRPVNGQVFKITNDPRVTSVGRLLRKTSLDELPQLFNIMRGEKSLVGPRPPIAYEIAHYKEWHRRRLEAKPGLTGLWQVSGRSSVPFNEMVLMDLYYIDNWSLWSDVKILLRTIPVIVSGKGAY
jgi:exopolysaccharide biosynthesis polyprenyl glycosylphosphotransferase